MLLEYTYANYCRSFKAARAQSIKNTSQLLHQIAKFLRSVDNFLQVPFWLHDEEHIDTSVAVIN